MSPEVEELLTQARTAANAAGDVKGLSQYLEHYRRHLLASLQKDAATQHKTVAAQEREAYSSSAYLNHIKAQQEATVDLAKKAWALKEAEYRIECWRTEQASLRMERKAYGA